MLGLVSPYVVRLRVCAQEYASTISFSLVADFPGLIWIALRIITPCSDFTYAQVNSAANRTTLWINPVSARTRVREAFGLSTRAW